MCQLICTGHLLVICSILEGPEARHVHLVQRPFRLSRLDAVPVGPSGPRMSSARQRTHLGALGGTLFRVTLKGTSGKTIISRGPPFLRHTHLILALCAELQSFLKLETGSRKSFLFRENDP